MSLLQHNEVAQQPVQAQNIQQEEQALKKITLDQLSDEQKSFSKAHKEDYYVNLNNAMRQEALSIADYKYSKREMLDNAKKMRNDSHILMLDEKWYSLFDAESAEMKAVKQSLAYLNQCLDKNVAMKNGMVDVNKLQDELFPAYRLAFDSCSAYLLAKDEQLRRKGPGKKRGKTGTRRYNKVKAMLDTLRDEYDNFKIFADNALQQTVAVSEEGTTVRDLLGEVRVKKATVSRFMPEGNSSNVYRVKVQGEDGKYYYVKIDEKLLHEDVEGYVNRRLEELNRSKGIFDKKDANASTEALDAKITEIDEKVLKGEMTEEEGDQEIIKLRAAREELRLEGKIDGTDYSNGIDFLTAIKNKLDSLTGQEKINKTDTYIKLFAHDFDKFFAQRTEYNATIREMRGDDAQINALIAELKKKEGQESQIAALEKAKASGNLQEMSEWEWFVSNLDAFGITQEADPEIYTVLQTIGTKQDGLSKLFTRSMGKELELFGQHAERSGLSKSDVLASNNTATSRLAGVFNFKDVVTTSFKGKLEFNEVGKLTKTVANVTFSEEAPGEELLSIMANAKAVQKEKGYKESIVKFSKDAIRQLNRLQVFDMMTLQTDRHWRNIKAIYEKKEDPTEWVIKSIKCYDHDQSFGNKDLRAYFKDVTDPKTGEVKTQKEGFLSPIMMSVSKSSNLFKYVKVTKMTNHKTGKSGIGSDNFFEDISMPVYNTQELKDKAEELNKGAKEKKDLYSRNPWTPFSRVRKNINWNDPKIKASISKFMLEKNPGKEEVINNFFEKLSILANLLVSYDGGAEHLSKKNILAGKISEEERRKAKEEYVTKGIEEWRKHHPNDDMDIFDEEDRLEKEFDSKSVSKKEVFRLLKDAHELYRQLDLTSLGEIEELKYNSAAENAMIGGANIPGYYDYSIQVFFHQAKLQFANDEDTNDIIEEIKKEEETALKANIRKNLQNNGFAGDALDQKVEEEYAKKSGKVIRMPAMLHMDEEAYNSILEAKNNPEKLELLLMDLNLTQDKKAALKARIDQIVEDVQEAQKVLNEWADMQGLEQNDIRRKFLLKKEDYDKIESLTDMALDPGMSYYSAEDSQFLTGVPEMQQFMSEQAVEKSREITNSERTTQRQKMGKLEGPYSSLVNNKLAS